MALSPAGPAWANLASQLVRLKFRPNPSTIRQRMWNRCWSGCREWCWWIRKDQHIARIDGTLFKDVGFGWGILGHLDRGGHFQVDQSEVGNNNWTIARMDLAFTGKMLLFKSLNIKSTEIYSDFHPVPADLTFAQGIDLTEEAAGGGGAESFSQQVGDCGVQMRISDLRFQIADFGTPMGFNLNESSNLKSRI